MRLMKERRLYPLLAATLPCHIARTEFLCGALGGGGNAVTQCYAFAGNQINENDSSGSESSFTGCVPQARLRLHGDDRDETGATNREEHGRREHGGARDCLEIRRPPMPPTTSQSKRMRTAASSCLTDGLFTSLPRISIYAATCNGSIAESSVPPRRSHQAKKRTTARKYARRVFGFRMEPAKNSRKRFGACSLARRMAAGNRSKRRAPDRAAVELEQGHAPWEVWCSLS
jgi:hypothetical protein